MIIDYPFTKIRPDDTPRPWLPVILVNPHANQSISVYGLIDTGADECAIPAGYAPMIGHNLQAGSQKTINTGNGPTAAYTHTLSLDVCGKIRIENVLIDFLPNLNVVLLGVRNFLSNYILTVDYLNSKISLKKS